MVWGKRGRPKKEEPTTEVKEELETPKPPIVSQNVASKKESYDRFVVKQIPTQVQSYIEDTETGEQYELLDALVAIMNKIEELDATING